MAKSSAKHQGPGQIRIIGGQWRGRKLSVAESQGLRPSTDRSRETLFNWLAPHLAGARCLDCYAGSGALGLEALSRHATQVTLLELQRTVVRQLAENITKLKAQHAQVIQCDTLQWLRQPASAFDIIFIDPPFRQGLLEQTIKLLEDYHWLASGAFIYTESEVEQKQPTIPLTWQIYREKVTGQVVSRLYRRSVSDNTGKIVC